MSGEAKTVSELCREALELRGSSRDFTDVKVHIRFWSKVKVDKIDSCWIWLGSKDQRGYGSFHYEGSRVKSHRMSWQLFHGKEFPENLLGCHSCDNPSCVNPHHIWPGTMSDNLKDCFEKGRGANMKEVAGISGKIRKEKTHCKRGHPLSGENMRITVKGSRLCKTCFKIMRQKHKNKESLK